MKNFKLPFIATLASFCMIACQKQDLQDVQTQNLTDPTPGNIVESLTVTSPNTNIDQSTIKVSIYGGSNGYTASDWNDWNVGTADGSNVTSPAFKYSDGSSSTVKATLTRSQGIKDNTTSYGSGMAPKEVLRFTSYSTVNRSLIISGLKAGNSYKLELFASRNYTGDGTKFTLGTQTYSVTTDNNLTNEAAFTANADANGQLKVDMARLKNYTYINGFVLSDASSSSSSSSQTTTTTPSGTHANYTLKPGPDGNIYYPNGLNIPNLKPGDTLNITAGYYKIIDLGAFSGDATHPIIIHNKGGQVTAQQIRLSNKAQYFKFLGNGASGITYGFKIDGQNVAATALVAWASDFELGYVEAFNATSGFFIKKNPVAGDPSTVYPNYVMKNIYIHHNYVHNTHGEAMYVGHTAPSGGQNGDPSIPIRLDHIEIAYNTVANCDWDGIQLSNARTNNSIHDNTITNYGVVNMSSQQAGILMGANTTGDIYNNVIKNGTGNGIQVFGFGKINVYNNTLENAGQNKTTKGLESIFANDYSSSPEVNPKQQINVYNNTIRYPQNWGAVRIGGYNNNSLPAYIQNNKVLVPNPLTNWVSTYLMAFSGSVISGNTLITQ